MNKLTNNIKATATATVENGVASTNNITYNEQLTPGQTYAINAEYLQNDNYLRETGVGELEILKLPTTTTITGNNNITYGENVTITIQVKDEQNNILTEGLVTIYDGNEIIQSNYTITGQSTSITFVPSTVGEHDVYAIYTDSNGVYNSSNSNHISITVNKLSSSITTNSNSISAYYDDTVTITGSLVCSGGTVSNQTIKLLDYDGTTVKQTVTTGNDGSFTLTYDCNSWNVHQNNLTISYEGTNTQNTSTKTIPVSLSRHDVTLSVADVTGYTDDEVEIVVEAVDENDDPVTEGTVTVDITYRGAIR